MKIKPYYLTINDNSISFHIILNRLSSGGDGWGFSIGFCHKAWYLGYRKERRTEEDENQLWNMRGR